MVIFFHYALCERQTQSPAAFLRGVARIEDILQVLARDTLAVVADIDDDETLVGVGGNLYRTLTLHSIDGILAEILEDPFEKLRIDIDDDFGSGIFYLYLLRGSAVHVFHHVLQEFAQLDVFHLRGRAYLGESVGNELQAFYVLVHLGYQVVVRIGLAQYLRPRHE